MAPADRDAIDLAFANVGKAIAAFERTLRVKPNALDSYAAGDTSALTLPQKTALQQFFITGCPQCHWGPRLTDDAFHIARFPTGRQDAKPDRGRFDVLQGLAVSEFVATTKWSDAPAAAKLLNLDSAPSMIGAFKTPPLRGIARTGPFGHGGTFTTLLEVSKHYGTRAEAVKDDRAIGDVEPWVPLFDPNVQISLPAILDVMTADVEP
jgi:cytochrome c peroxidase